MNSAAALKAFCGARGGSCAPPPTPPGSSSGLARGERVLFFPDEHLGRNTGDKSVCLTMAMVVWDPRRPLGGNTSRGATRSAPHSLRGWCSVARALTVAQIAAARRRYRRSTSSCTGVPPRVVAAADVDGSTELILDTIASAPPAASGRSAPRINMVNRLAAAHPEQADLLPGSGDLPVLDHVPHPSRVPRVGAGSASSTATW